ncbi:MAG: CapA family protein [Coriobacteriales bacterium]|nr:CapA family protein [Coriobacteriales bacterium]
MTDTPHGSVPSASDSPNSPKHQSHQHAPQHAQARPDATPSEGGSSHAPEHAAHFSGVFAEDDEAGFEEDPVDDRPADDDADGDLTLGGDQPDCGSAMGDASAGAGDDDADRKVDGDGSPDGGASDDSDAVDGSDTADDSDREPEVPNPYEDADIYEPYEDEEERRDIEEERVESSVAEYSRANAAQHYRREHHDEFLPILFMVVAGIAVAAGLVVYVAGVIPMLLPGATSPLHNEIEQEEASDQGDSSGDTSTQAQAVDINLTMVGDMVTQGTVVSASQTTSGTYDFSNLFSDTSSDISSADVALVDQESAIAGQTYGYGSGVPYNAPDTLATAEANAGIDVVLKASNYALDLGYDGLHDELTNWAKNEPNLQVLGVADPEGTAGTDRVNNVYIYEKDGFKVAILNYTYGTDTTVSKSTDSSYVATLSEDKVKADVQAAKDAGADMIVACPHWGTEYSTEISSEQSTYAQLFADEGVDVVIGDHPHVVQPVEVITNSSGHKTVCYYSVGNYVSASKSTAALIGGIAKVTLHKDTDGTCSVTAASLVPVVTHRANGNSYGVYKLSDYTQQLAQKGWDTYMTPTYVKSYLDSTLSDLTYDESAGAYTVSLG